MAFRIIAEAGGRKELSALLESRKRHVSVDMLGFQNHDIVFGAILRIPRHIGTSEERSNAVPRTTDYFTKVLVSNCLSHIPSRFKSACSPDLHRLISTPGGDASAIRRPCYLIHT